MIPEKNYTVQAELEIENVSNTYSIPVELEKIVETEEYESESYFGQTVYHNKMYS